ncbi:hypothetical protein ANO11243_052780 [Dothideomycetidae sp. 11243]|nr:hypothetical protein ANO11243_052780 [fungal sp. No.11243]
MDFVTSSADSHAEAGAYKDSSPVPNGVQREESLAVLKRPRQDQSCSMPAKNVKIANDDDANSLSPSHRTRHSHMQVTLTDAVPPSPPALVIDLESLDRTQNYHIAQFPFCSTDLRTPELAARALASHARSASLTDKTVDELTAWFVQVKSYDGVEQSKELDAYFLNHAFWQHLACTLKEITIKHAPPLGKLWAHDPPQYVAFVEATASLARSMLILEARLAETHSTRRDSIVESKQPYLIRCTDVLSALTALLSDRSLASLAIKHPLVHTRICQIATTFLKDHTSASALMRFLFTMLSGQDSIQHVLIHFRVFLGLLRQLLNYSNSLSSLDGPHWQRLRDDVTLLLKRTNGCLLSLLSSGVESLDSLKARLPILDHLFWIYEDTLAVLDREECHQYDLSFIDLLIASPSSHGQGDAERTTLIEGSRQDSREELERHSPTTVALAWYFATGHCFLASTQPTQARFGMDVLDEAVRKAAIHFAESGRSAEMKSLFKFLACSGFLDSMLRYPSSPAMINRYDAVLKLYIQTGNFGSREIAAVFQMTGKSASCAMRASYSSLFERVIERTLSEDQVADVLRTFLQFDMDLITSYSLRLVTACIVRFKCSAPMAFESNLKLDLVTRLKRLLRGTSSAGLQDHGDAIDNLLLKALGHLCECSLQDQDLENLVTDCLGMRSTPLSLINNRILFTVQSSCHFQLGKMKLLDNIAKSAYLGLKDALQNMIHTDTTPVSSRALETAYLTHLELVLQSISILSKEQVCIDHNGLWECIVGEMAMFKSHVGDNGLILAMQCAQRSDNIASMLNSCIVDDISSITARLTTNGLLRTMDYIFAEHARNRFKSVAAFCSATMSALLRVKDDGTMPQAMEILLNRVFSTRLATQSQETRSIQQAVTTSCIDSLISGNTRAPQVLGELLDCSLRMRSFLASRKPACTARLCFAQDLLTSVDLRVSIYDPTKPLVTAIWTIDRSTSLAGLRTLLQKCLQADKVDAYWRGKNILAQPSPCRELEGVIQFDADTTLLVRAVSENGLSPANKTILGPRTVVEEVIVGKYSRLSEKLCEDGLMGRAVEMNDRELALARCKLSTLPTQSRCETLNAIESLYVDLMQQYKQNSIDFHKVAEAVNVLVMIICRFSDHGTDYITTLFCASRILNIYLKEFVDDDTRTRFFQSPEMFVVSIANHIKIISSLLASPGSDSPSTATRTECVASLCENLLEAALVSQDIFQLLTNGDSNLVDIYGLLTASNLPAREMIAFALHKACMTFPDSETECMLHGGVDGVYADAYLLRSINLKIWICHNALEALLHVSAEANVSMLLLKMAMASLSGKAVRSRMIEFNFQGLFSQIFGCISLLSEQAHIEIQDREAAVEFTCTLLLFCVTALNERGSALQVQ